MKTTWEVVIGSIWIYVGRNGSTSNVVEYA